MDDKPYHVRVLTPRESWRLMGFYDSDYDKIKDILPETARYHLAGNSMIVQVLESIFAELL
ncbi:MAG: DNA cytosine methyltransferase [Paraclostridium sp.]